MNDHLAYHAQLALIEVNTASCELGFDGWSSCHSMCRIIKVGQPSLI